MTPVPRMVRGAAYMAILYGLFGAFSGIIAASTFYYFEGTSDYTEAATAPLTVIAAIGAAVCVLAIVSGWGLLRERPWAWRWTWGTSLAALGCVTFLVAFWPARWGFLVFVVAAYALLLGLLWFVHPTVMASARRPAGA